MIFAYLILEVVNIATGYLVVEALELDKTPIQDAKIRVYQMKDGTMVYERIHYTDEKGKCETIALPAPDPEISLHRYGGRPYESYNVEVQKEGYQIEERQGVQIFPGVGSTLSVPMQKSASRTPSRNKIIIDEHTLYDEMEDPHA